MTIESLPPSLARNRRLDRWVEIRADGVVEVVDPVPRDAASCGPLAAGAVSLGIPAMPRAPG